MGKTLGEILRARLGEYRRAKAAYEDLVAAASKSWTPGQPWPEHVKAAEAHVDVLKAAGGEGRPGDAPCCQRYGRLHEPAFSLPGCPWEGLT